MKRPSRDEGEFRDVEMNRRSNPQSGLFNDNLHRLTFRREGAHRKRASKKIWASFFG
jgi:hypothetical protein